MLKKIHDWFDGGYDRNFYKHHQEDINKSNSKIISIGLISIALFLIAFIIIGNVTEIIHVHMLSFSIMLGIILILFILQIAVVKKSFLGTIIISVVFIISFYAFLIIEETFLHPDRPGSIMYLFMIAVPITIIAPVYATLNVNVISFIVFIILCYFNKEKNIFYLDLMFGLCSLIAGTFLGRRVVLNKFESFDLSEKLKYQSRYDPLTNIYNRRAARKKLEEILEVEDKVAVAMIDIDDFKLYNDTYGHLKGDEVLRTIASIFLYHVKKYGFFVSRFGGEEFLLVTFGSRVDLMHQILLDSTNDLKTANIIDENSKYGCVTFSAGFTTTSSCKDIEKLVETADKALYIAKNHGKNEIVYSEINE